MKYEPQRVNECMRISAILQIKNNNMQYYTVKQAKYCHNTNINTDHCFEVLYCFVASNDACFAQQ